MYNRYSDFEELRPTGEASHVPDEKLSECGDGDPRRQRVATPRTAYFDQPSETDNECRSCGASIPASQTKCRFCLTNHLDGTRSDATGEDTERTLVGIVYMVVESATFYGAVAKGGAAANLLTTNDTGPSIVDCTLIYDLDDDPAPQLRDRWPSLPAAVQVASADGERLLAAARDRMGWSGQPESESHQETTTRLYDESGGRIRDVSHLETILDDDGDGDEAWLVPALALSATTDEKEASSQQAMISTRDLLKCQNCGRGTDHRFRTYESVPDEAWTGQPIWECDVCGTTRYGQSPE